MKFKDFYSYVEAHSTPGSVLVFQDDQYPLSFRTDPQRTYDWVPYIGSADMTIAFVPNDQGGRALERDAFLGFLSSLDCRPRLKCQLALYNDQGDFRGYLTDNLWSHITSEEDNVFVLDNGAPQGRADATGGLLDLSGRDSFTDSYTSVNMG